MREKSIGGAPAVAAPISHFATAHIRELDWHRWNISLPTTARLPFAAVSERVSRLFVMGPTSHNVSIKNSTTDGASIAKLAPMSKVHTGNVC